MKSTLTVWLFLLTVLSVAQAQEAFRLEQAIGAPDWLTLKGEARVRYESLEGQFRRGREGSDQLLLFRTLLHAEADTGPISFGLELQDSRTYLGDFGTPLSNSFTNTLDFLQLYAQANDLPGILGARSNSKLILGRQTISIGSKRQIERVSYANVIKSYSGAHFISQSQRGDEFHAFVVVPVARFPNTRPAIDDNEIEADKEQWGRRIWGIHFRRADILPNFASDVWGEIFIYGLDENDRENLQTPDRSYLAPGFRLYREPRIGRLDIDLEAAIRKGERRATSNRLDTQKLEVDAATVFVAIGFMFDTSWNPRLSLEYYYASGDKDPNDLNFDQHERLFGGRRTDLNNTSIHGPLTPANLSAPGFRIQVTPNTRWDGWFQYHAAHLASNTDSWVIADLRDPTGLSGSFIGHTLDARARYWILPDSLRFEIGASGLIYGEFPKSVPEGPDGDATLFGYAQLTFRF